LSGKYYHGKDKPNNYQQSFATTGQGQEGKSSTGAHSTQNDEVIFLVCFLYFISRFVVMMLCFVILANHQRQ
jgi:hypothetical protein